MNCRMEIIMQEKDVYDVLNSILVKIFNDILNIEEKALIVGEFSDITVNDMHIIDAAGNKEPKTMSQISKTLGVTMGTLTIGINGLVKKGYIERNRAEHDRRVVYASLTEKGLRAYRHHQGFHENLVSSVIEDMDEKEAQMLLKTMSKLDRFFEKLKKQGKEQR